MGYDLIFFVRIIASLVELLGAFFLSVEAMKLQNFRRLRDRLLRPMHSWINPTVRVRRGRDSIILDVQSDSVNSILSAGACGQIWKIVFNGWVWLISAMWTAGFFGFALIVGGLGSPHHSIIRTIEHIAPGIPFLGQTLAVIVLMVGGLFAGLLLYTLIVVIIQGSILLLDVVDRNTPSGTIGMLVSMAL